MKEERKSGGVSSASGSVFKSAGQDTVHRYQRKDSLNTRSQQLTQMSNNNAGDTTAASILSSPSIQGERMGYGGQPSMGIGGYNQPQYQNQMVNRGMGQPGAYQQQSYYPGERGMV